MGHESGLEWPLSLDVPSIIAGGWRPFPFCEFIVKIHSRCDLSCDYCYMYEMADQSWRDQPHRMSIDVAGRTAARIGEHVQAHRIPDISLILHGGEPLLAGPELIGHLVTATRAAAGSDVAVDACIQTNGVGLNESSLELLRALGVRVGVSLDGTAAGHDLHRRFASGRGSHAAVSAGLMRLRSASYRHLFSGLLCTIDLRNDPIATYEALVAFEPPRIDFLLPHGTWDSPPPGRSPDVADTPYGDWLIAVFDHWYRAPVTGIRLFEDVMRLILRGTSSGEAVGLAPARMLVIETDGAIEQVDILKIAYHGAAATGLHVADDPFDVALSRPGVVARQLGVLGLAPRCRSCRIHRVCGGGMYAHRYKSGTGFANPSVYCPDLMRLIDHISEVVAADVGARLRGRAF